MYVSVCVCERERERERKGGGGEFIKKTGKTGVRRCGKYLLKRLA